ncbi:inovirus Gp2 family protein [Citrobacter freundii]
MIINTATFGPFNERHISRIQDTLNKALEEYPRILLLRIDLRLPDDEHVDSSVITKFIVSLKEQIKSDLHRKKMTGKRTFLCHLRHIWVREFSQSGKKHYHVALLINKDNYAYPGSYKSIEGVYTHNLAVMIMEAWVRALSLEKEYNYQRYYSLVHFPRHCSFHLNRYSIEFVNQYKSATERLSYFAKEYSKDYSDGQRNFGCSQY